MPAHAPCKQVGARLKTKEPTAFELWLIGKAGQFNLSRLEGLGRDPEVETDRADGCDVTRLRFVSADHLHPQKLKAVLAEHLKGFKATFADAAGEKEAG